MTIQKNRVPTSEGLLIDAIGNEPANSVLCTSLGRGQLASELSNRWPEAQVTCHFLDIYLANQSANWLEPRGPSVDVVCSPDFPETECDLVAIPCLARGDGELTRDLLQTGFLRLQLGGLLFVSTDNRRDKWLGELMKGLFRKVARFPARDGIVYRSTKTEPLRKIKDYSCEFAFRDGLRLIRGFSRSGVFSHRRLDVGARALIESMEVHAGNRVLDLGCGTGVVSLAAAQRAAEVQVVAVDANPRAVECTLRGAEMNGLSNIRVILNADAESDAAGSFDLALANPPYYSNYRIGEIFVRGAARALRRGGILQLVTKQPEPYVTLVEQDFCNVAVTAVRQYFIVRADRK